MVNNTRNNTTSEISAKKSLKTFNEIKNAEIIKHKKRTPKQKFNRCNFKWHNTKIKNSKRQNINVIKRWKWKWKWKRKWTQKENENKNENENDKTLIIKKTTK